MFLRANQPSFKDHQSHSIMHDGMSDGDDRPSKLRPQPEHLNRAVGGVHACLARFAFYPGKFPKASPNAFGRPTVNKNFATTPFPPPYHHGNVMNIDRVAPPTSMRYLFL